MPLFLLSLLGNLPGLIGQFFATKAQVRLAEIQQQESLQLKALDNQGQAATADSNRAIAVINAQANSLRTFAYLLIAFPFVCCLINRPDYVNTVFNNLDSLPDWYTVLFAGLTANMWGIPVPGSLMNGITQGISNAVHNRRAYKLLKNGIDPQTYFDAKRQAKGGMLTQADVDEGNKELDILNKND